jgi:hypothetical protein
MKKANGLNLFSILLSILISLLLLTAAWTQQTPQSIECSSISTILANPKACDNRPVRIEGKVIQFKLQTSKKGNPYTEFTLADGSQTLMFFSYEHLPLEKGICVQVEGIYYVRREAGSFIFENQVVVEKKTEGVATVPCPPAIPSLPVWKWWKVTGGAILILIILAIAVGKMLKPARYHRMGRSFEEYIIGLFPDTDWEIKDRSSDTSRRIGRRITGDVSYDFIMKHRSTSRRFIIQCKYRSRFYRQGDQEGIEWAKPYQIRNYQNFQQAEGCPYVVVIGLGGRPRQPEHLFVLPLASLRYPFIEKMNLLAAKRDPRTIFAVDDDGVLR